ncbi:DUF3035 domain-containing protein [Pseudoprimorskyibacter insulae]|uniref:Beta-barrel assembly machine subunit BamF n=1 Tax=Pseudoprimorskyibacter insulae TaxID=1695997 RepID=A0A2R8AV62_9RHOB|nr:DUF3035 domain-containing protein [Pseudoprimorskyibacter insulae]SPF79896.1 hypothetical protein PRI8871_01697 [Pseudoprimorskyibacter insulae]
MTGPRLAILLGLLAVSACGGRQERDITLHDMRTNQRSPEEFSILPVKPLQMPETTALPTPTPGGANLTDPTPLEDAVAVLGGKPQRVAGTGVPAADVGMLAHVGRFGTDPNIRADLAAKDLELRKTKSRFTWSIVPRDDYRRAYRSHLLNPYSELSRFRKLGIKTPAAPSEE